MPEIWRTDSQIPPELEQPSRDTSRRIVLAFYTLPTVENGVISLGGAGASWLAKRAAKLLTGSEENLVQSGEELRRYYREHIVQSNDLDTEEGFDIWRSGLGKLHPDELRTIDHNVDYNVALKTNLLAESFGIAITESKLYPSLQQIAKTVRVEAIPNYPLANCPRVNIAVVANSAVCESRLRERAIQKRLKRSLEIDDPVERQKFLDEHPIRSLEEIRESRIIRYFIDINNNSYSYPSLIYNPNKLYTLAHFVIDNSESVDIHRMDQFIAMSIGLMAEFTPALGPAMLGALAKNYQSW